jgi:hypothetical protein
MRLGWGCIDLRSPHLPLICHTKIQLPAYFPKISARKIKLFYTFLKNYYLWGMEKGKTKNIAFNSPAALPVYHRFRELFKRVKEEREEATGKKYYAWMLILEMIELWEHQNETE